MGKARNAVATLDLRPYAIAAVVGLLAWAWGGAGSSSGVFGEGRDGQAATESAATESAATEPAATEPAETKAPASQAEVPLSVLAAFGFGVTEGAVPGYVEDQSCAMCHREIATSYQEVGMAKSFARADEAEIVEDFEAQPYFHERSGRYYQMQRSAPGEDKGDDGKLRLRRWQLDELGQEINVVDQEVDWVLGSGHTSRVYLRHAPNGQLFQLPLAWYSQDGGHWAMAPGNDRSDHLGMNRLIRRECMFCHNAYPEVPSGADSIEAPHIFPSDLPQGTGCQRCHGPGARHLALALSGEDDPEILGSTIVNPGRLEPNLRNDVCYGCHMQPAVAMMGSRRMERDVYSFRPGESLAKYLVQADIVGERQGSDDRFEINHHPYRLEQSRCFLDSRDEQGASALSCLSCHDPHRKVPTEERAAHYRQACLSCHAVDACGLPEMRAQHPESAQRFQGMDPADCATCHMPRRRTEDVVHVVMTDHKIVRLPEAAQTRLAAREEEDPVVREVRLFEPIGGSPQEVEAGTAEGEVYRSLALVQAGGGRLALEQLHASLEAARLVEGRLEATPAWMALAKGQVKEGQVDAAEAAIQKVLDAQGESSPLLRYWALARVGKGKTRQAISLLRRAHELDPTSAENLYNLGLLQLRSGEPAEAERSLRQAIELNPLFSAPHQVLGQALEALGRFEEAEASYTSALRAEPGFGKAYLSLATLLRSQGRVAEAQRWLRHGRRWSNEGAVLDGVLKQWQGEVENGAEDRPADGAQ